MTEKRFINDIDNGQLIDTKGELSTIDYSDKVDFYELWEFLNKLNDENEHYKALFFEIVEAALTDKNCRELYCKGILDMFDKANSLNQARDMIKEYLE